MSSGKILAGFLAGVTVGAILGVLFAPDMGWNTRKRISKKTEYLADDLREKFDEFLDNILAKTEEGQEGDADFSDNNKVEASEAKI